MIKKIAIFRKRNDAFMEQNLTFAELGLSPEILQALEQKGYGYPTKIQAEAIPPFMEWKDVIAKAPTGTGKTFAFGIPMIEMATPLRFARPVRPMRWM